MLHFILIHVTLNFNIYFVWFWNSPEYLSFVLLFHRSECFLIHFHFRHFAVTWNYFNWFWFDFKLKLITLLFLMLSFYTKTIKNRLLSSIYSSEKISRQLIWQVDSLSSANSEIHWVHFMNSVQLSVSYDVIYQALFDAF